MKIAATQIDMQASHTLVKQFESSERLQLWVGDRRPDEARPAALAAPAAATRVSLSEQAVAAQQAETGKTQASSGEDAAGSDPRLRMLKSMIEFLTGRRIKIFDASELLHNRAAASSATPVDSPVSRAGFGMAYDYQSSYSEYEAVSFAASGKVRTADGREIDFEIAFSMQRSYSESTQFSFRAGAAVQLKDPLVFDFSGPAAALSDLRFSFDIDADGQLDSLPMLGGGQGFLAFDRNANGRIDDGRELFGALSGDGFAELAALDSDGNGWIDEGDQAFDKLYVWRPAAEGTGVMQTLREAGIGALYLGRVATPFEVRNGANETLGVMRSSGIYLREDGSAGTLSQVDLSV